MGRYRLTRRADQDLIDIYLFTLERFGPEQAERYTESIKSCLGLLADNPLLGRKANLIRPGMRRHEHGRHVIFYREETNDESVLILTAMHASMQPKLSPED